MKKTPLFDYEQPNEFSGLEDANPTIDTDPQSGGLVVDWAAKPEGLGRDKKTKRRRQYLRAVIGRIARLLFVRTLTVLTMLLF